MFYYRTLNICRYGMAHESQHKNVTGYTYVYNYIYFIVGEATLT